MPESTNTNTIIHGIRDWFLIAAAIGVTIWGFTLPDLPDDPKVRLYMNERAAKQAAMNTEPAPVSQSNNAVEATPLPQSAAATPASTSGDLIKAGPNQLIDAIKASRLEQAKSLLGDGADVNEEDSQGNTPLIWAARTHNVAAVKLLLAQDGITVSSQNQDGVSAFAFTFDNEEIADLLKAKGAVR